MIITILGLIATITSLISLPPQLYHVYTTKSGDGLSMFMLINFLISTIAWTAYGYLTNTTSVLITNIIMATFWLAMIILKIKYTS